MKKYLKLRSEIFGLDIDDSSLKIVKLKEKMGSVVLVSLNEVKLESGIIEDGIVKNIEALSESIKQACKTAKGEKLGTKYVIASLPEEKSFLQVIEMPKMQEKELKAAAIFEVENYIPLPIETIYVDFQEITGKKTQGQSEVLLVAMPKSVVDPYVQSLEKAGLIPFALEPQSQAVARAVLGRQNDEKPIAVLDVRKSKSNLIIYAGNSVRFTCSIEAEAFGADFCSTVKKYLNFYSEHFFQAESYNKVEKIILCGSEAGNFSSHEIPQKELCVSLGSADIFSGIKISPSLSASPSFVTALGLAKRGLLEGREYPHI